MENKFINFIKEVAPHSYRPPECLECKDISGTYSMKCAEGVYLNVSGNGWELFSGDSALSVEELTASSDLDGWSAQLVFAPGKSISCEFGNNSISSDGESLETVISKVGEDLYLVHTKDGAFIMALDIQRFLFYGAWKDACFGGYVSLVA